MKKWMVPAVLSLVAGVSVPMAVVHADGESMMQEEAARARKTMEEDRIRLQREDAQRRQEGAVARKRLRSEFGVDASGMSDTDAIVRLRDAINDRAAAREAAQQQRREEAEAARERARQEQLKRQETRLQETFGGGSGAISDDEDAAELHMYEAMVRNGVAPQCRGKQGAALISCVDAATGSE
jgi:hypothetical protein